MLRQQDCVCGSNLKLTTVSICDGRYIGTDTYHERDTTVEIQNEQLSFSSYSFRHLKPAWVYFRWSSMSHDYGSLSDVRVKGLVRSLSPRSAAAQSELRRQREKKKCRVWCYCLPTTKSNAMCSACNKMVAHCINL